jgi:hypothetical protein
MPQLLPPDHFGDAARALAGPHRTPGTPAGIWCPVQHREVAERHSGEIDHSGHAVPPLAFS